MSENDGLVEPHSTGSEWMDAVKPVANAVESKEGGLAFAGLEDHSSSDACACSLWSVNGDVV